MKVQTMLPAPRHLAAIAVLLLLQWLCFGAAGPAAELPGDSNADPGSVRVWKEKDAAGRTWFKAEFCVAAPPATVFAVLLDAERFPEFMPDVKEAKIIEAGEGFQVVRFRAGSGLRESRHVLRRLYDPEQGRLSWTLVEGRPRALEGIWQIEAASEEGSSLVRYAAHVDAGFWIPDAVVRHFQRRTVPEMIASIRQRLETGNQ